MGDYISRDMAIARLTKVEVTNRLATMTDAKRVIAEMPAADVAPVVHGRETREGGSTMISEAVDRAVKAKWRADLINMLTDAGRTLAGTGLQVNGVRYQGVLLGPLLMRAAAALEKCWKREGLIQAEAKPGKPGDVVVKITVPDRWPMTEAGQRRAAQEAAAPKPTTNSGGQTMAEYIDRVEYCEKHCRCSNEYCDRQSCPIWKAPAADVAPVVHGEWEAVDWREYDASSCEVICYPKDGIACTHCRYVFKKDALWKKNFCPNCGAKMDGGADNETD